MAEFADFPNIPRQNTSNNTKYDDCCKYSEIIDLVKAKSQNQELFINEEAFLRFTHTEKVLVARTSASFPTHKSSSDTRIICIYTHKATLKDPCDCVNTICT